MPHYFVVLFLCTIWILSYGFFYCTYLPINVCKIVAWLTNLVFLFFFLINYSSFGRYKYWSPLSLLILWGGFVPLFTSFIFHGQDIDMSIRTVLPWFQFCFCFVLLYYSVSESDLYKAILCFCVVYLLLYVAAVFHAPNFLFDPSGGVGFESIEQGRGWYRIKIVGDGFVHLMLYWQINKYVINRKKSNMLLAIMCFIMVLLSLSRQHMLIAFCLSFFFLLKNSSWAMRFGVLAIMLFVFLYLLPQSDIYNSLLDLTTSQLDKNDNGKDDVRILAYKFYIGYNENILQDILGNGIFHSDSKWGQSIYRIMIERGYVLADVGLVSLFFYYGYLGCAIILRFLFMIFSSNLDKAHTFVKYYVLSVILGTVFSHTFDMCLLQLSIIYYMIFINNKRHVYARLVKTTLKDYL